MAEPLIICDANPLILLAKIGTLDLLSLAADHPLSER